MAKRKVNKSAKIRDALESTPDKSAGEIAIEIGVSPALVYNVKAMMKKKAGKTKGKPGPKSNGKVVAPQSAHAALDSAFDFVMKVGGLIHAEQLIDKLKSIKERL